MYLSNYQFLLFESLEFLMNIQKKNKITNNEKMEWIPNFPDLFHTRE